MNASDAMDALTATLRDLSLRVHVGQRVDVFGGLDGHAGRNRDPASTHPLPGFPEWAQHPACDDLQAAVRHLGCDAQVDVAWVHAGTRLPPGWPDRLQQGLWDEPALGALSPLNLDDPWFSPLDGSAGGRDGDPVGMAFALSEWLAAHAAAPALELGGPMVSCGVLRAEAAAALARQASGRVIAMATAMASATATASASASGAVSNTLTDPGRPGWVEELSARGWILGVSRRMVVCHDPVRAGAWASIPGSGLTAARDLWRHAHPLTAVRHAAKEIWPRLAPPAPASGTPPQACGAPSAQAATQRPIVRLHVAHSWGGGLSKWVRDFVRTDQALGTGTGLVLRSVGVFGAFGQRLSLYAGEEDVVPLRFWELGVPIHATAVAHLEVRRILREIIEDYGVEQVLVSSLIGHSLDVLRTGLPTLMVAHDHHPFCIALYAHFEGECRSCDGARLERCVQHNPGHRFFQGVSPGDWLTLREAFVNTVSQAHLPIVAPSPSVAKRWQSMMPALAPSQFRVIPHGVALPQTPPFDPPEKGPLRIVVLGRISPEKGAELLIQMLPQLLAFAELVLVGCGERLDPALRHPRIETIPQFDNETLPAVLAAARPHLGLMMSTVPETFSYALTELWHAGIPVLATDSGALADRVEPGVTGHLVAADAQAILAQLAVLNQQREGLATMRAEILRRPARTLDAMLRDYEALLPRAAHAPSAPARAALLASLQRAAQASSEPGGLRTHRPAHQQSVQVNPEVTWWQAARGFWQFTCLKASRSPRLPGWLQRWFAGRA